MISLLSTVGRLDLTGVNDGRGTTDLKYGRSLFFTVRGDRVVSLPSVRLTSLKVFLVRLALVNFVFTDSWT